MGGGAFGLWVRLLEGGQKAVRCLLWDGCWCVTSGDSSLRSRVTEKGAPARHPRAERRVSGGKVHRGSAWQTAGRFFAALKKDRKGCSYTSPSSGAKGLRREGASGVGVAVSREILRCAQERQKRVLLHVTLERSEGSQAGGCIGGWCGSQPGDSSSRSRMTLSRGPHVRPPPWVPDRGPARRAWALDIGRWFRPASGT